MRGLSLGAEEGHLCQVRANGNRRPNTLAHMGPGTVNPQLLLWRSWSAWRPEVLEAWKHWMRCWALIEIWPRTPTRLTPWPTFNYILPHIKGTLIYALQHYQWHKKTEMFLFVVR